MDVLMRMLEATVVTLREGMEAALVVGLTLAYLRRTGRGDLTRYAYLGLVVALLASVAGAIVFQRYGLDPENEVWEGSLMLAAAALVGSLVVWMWRAGRRAGHEAQARLETLVRNGTPGGALGVFLFTFLMVFREGVEAALFLGALSGTIGANPLNNALGGGLGLLLAALFGALLVRGSLKVDLSRFFRVTGLVLLLLAAKLAANGLHEFFEAGLIPSSHAVLIVVGLLTRDSTSVLILVLLIALPAGVLLREAFRRETVGALPGETPAELRKRRAELRASRSWTVTAGATGLALSVLLALSATVARGYDPAPTPLALSGPLLRIPLTELRDHPMRKYTVSVRGVSVRFFVVRGREDRLAVAFDACAICPPKGYMLVGDQLVCRNCGAPISFDTIGRPGGCNPIPLEAVVEAGEILIRAEDLAEGTIPFARGS